MTLLRSRETVIARAQARSSERWLLPGLVLAVVAARTTYLFQPLRSDEGGYLLVARHWHTGGEFLYGDYHVDRPPLLMLIFRVAALTGWDATIRVLTIPFVLLLVLAAWQAGRMLGGPAGGRWAALLAAAFGCSPALASDQADGELFAVPFVLGGIALALAAWRATGARQWALAVTAGVLAGSAPLVKQNLLEGLVFVTILVAAAVWRQRRAGRREVVVGVGSLLGALLPYLAVAWWSSSVGVDLGGVWHGLLGFRAEAFDVIWSHSPQASVKRAGKLFLLALVSGVLAILVVWTTTFRPRRAPAPEHWAITGCLVFGVVSVAAGGSYWPHYLIELVPALVLAVAVLAPGLDRAGRATRAIAWAAVGAAAVGTVGMAVVYATVPGVWFQQRTGEWLAASAAPGDTVFVAYGNAAVLEAADLGSPYPYLWSLPMRTLDPDLARLRSTLAGPRAPAWIVQVNGLDSWGIDEGERLRGLVERRYRVVGEVCGSPVWLRVGVDRSPAPAPRC